MFALSNVDNEKAQLFMAAMSRDGLTAEQFMQIRDRYDPTEFGEWDDDMFPTPHHEDDDPNEEDGEGESEGDIALRELYLAIGDYVAGQGLGDVIHVAFNGTNLLLTLKNDIWFEPGSAAITPAMHETGVILAELLASLFAPNDPFEIVVAGHTDNVPQTRPPFRSNWHLGNGRAASFVELLVTESELDPWYFYTRSAGEFRPIASNDTEAGRQENRRVEVMIQLARDEPVMDQGVSNY
jgi:chemotaxis protein MotB